MNELNGRKVRHKRTGIIRTIYVLEDDRDTPSIAALKNKYNPLTDLLFDTYESNKQFFDLL